MTPSTGLNMLALRTLFFAYVWVLSEGVSFPLKVSKNDRYLVDAKDEAFFFMGDTPWQMMHDMQLPAIKSFILTRRAQNFTVLQLTGLNWNTGSPNAYGDCVYEKDEHGHMIYSKPNPKYWAVINQTMEFMLENEMVAWFIPLWAHYTHDQSNADMYAASRFIGNLLKGYPNLIWVLGGDDPTPNVAQYEQMRAGIRDSGATQIMTLHPVGPRSSSNDMFGSLKPYLDFNSVQCRGELSQMVGMVSHDYDINPPKAVYVAETWYEGPVNNSGCCNLADGPPLRSYYYCGRIYGGFGNTYASWVIWDYMNKPDQTKTAINRPGAVQLATYMSRIFKSIDWFNHQPDTEHQVAEAGKQVHVSFSLSSRTALAYLEAPAYSAQLSVHGSWFNSHFTVEWYDPETGQLVQKEPRSGSTTISLRVPSSLSIIDAVAVLRMK